VKVNGGMGEVNLASGCFWGRGREPGSRALCRKEERREGAARRNTPDFQRIWGGDEKPYFRDRRGGRYSHSFREEGGDGKSKDPDAFPEGENGGWREEGEVRGFFRIGK